VAFIAYLMRPTIIDVDAGTVVRRPLRETIDAEGKTRVRDRFVIAAPVTGHLQRLAVREGTAIARGQVVAWIAPLPLDEATRRQAEARVASAVALASEADSRVAQARVAAEQARRVLHRRDALLAAGAVSAESREQFAVESRARDDEFTAAEARSRAALAEVNVARAALVGADSRRGVLIPIRSPVRGKVLRIPEMSERVTAAGTALLELGDATAIEVVVDVLSSDAVRICAGQEVEIIEWGGELSLRGRVRSVEPSAFTKVSALGVDEQRVNVIVDILGVPPTLGDGFRVEARILVWGPNAVLTVPASALVQRASGDWMVFVIDGGRARERDVRIGHRTSGAVEVTAGLQPGAEVVLFPSDNIRDGVRVRPQTISRE
jgi:HlyD family secretion protein